MALSKAGREAWKALAESVHRKGANCDTVADASEWTGWVDAEGIERLPTAKRAKELCAGCPQLGKECLEAKSKGDYSFGVVNGEVIDRWKQEGRKE